MVVSAVEHTGEVPGFTDRLGERIVVPQPSGVFLEHLHFRGELASAAFFESAVKNRLKRLANFRHASYSRATRVQRDPASHRLALVSSYTTGRRLSDVILLARRARIQPRIGAVVSLTRQLMTSAALLHDYAPDVFHGALGPERLVVGPDGRLVITEYVLGAAVEQAIVEWGPGPLWRDYRIAAFVDASAARFGRRLDLVQIGLVTLALLVGRPLTEADYPDGLAALLKSARETTGDGEPTPLGAPFADWLAKLLSIEPANGFRTLVEAQKAFSRVVDDEPRYGVSSLAVEAFLNQCDAAAALPGLPSERETGEGGAFPPRPLPRSSEASAEAVETPRPATPRAETPRAETPRPEPSQTETPPEPRREVEQEPALAQAAPRPETPRADVAPAAAAADTPAPQTDGPRSNAQEVPPDDQFWPVEVGSDTIGTLFETFKPRGPVRESHIVSIPDTERDEERPSARDELAAYGTTGDDESAALPPLGSNVPPAEPSADETPADGIPASADWLQPEERNDAARQLREAVIESPPLSGQFPVNRTGLYTGPEGLNEPPTVPTNTWVPSFASPPAASHDVAVVETQPPASPVGERPRQAQHLPGERRGAAPVLSYDDVHRHGAERRSKIWLTLAAVVVGLVVVGGTVIGVRFWSSRASGPSDRAGTSGQQAKAAALAPGGLRVVTEPPGGRITIDGTPRGASPLSLDGLSAGSHLLTAESNWGSADQMVKVEPGKVTTTTVVIAGWVKFTAPFELIVSEEGRNYGTTGRGPLMVPSGRHHFDLVNQSVAVRLTQFVDVPAGQVTTVALEIPAGTLNLSSDQPAEVLLDGRPIGRTPLMSLSATLGPHEVVFRSEKYGEVSYTVNVTLAAPVRLTVNFLKR